MPLGAGCPRCAQEVSADGEWWRCPDHGDAAVLWRPSAADYDGFADHVGRSGSLPTIGPWPLTPGWAITDFGCVTTRDGTGRASFLTCAGPSDPDGVVELTVVSEEPGVGLGARCAGMRRTDPGADIGDGPPHGKVRIAGHPVPLWSVLTSEEDDESDRFVFAGESGGRWLWVVLRPASAALLLNDEWVMTDIAELGPELIDLPFGQAPPAW